MKIVCIFALLLLFSLSLGWKIASSKSITTTHAHNQQRNQVKSTMWKGEKQLNTRYNTRYRMPYGFCVCLQTFVFIPFRSVRSFDRLLARSIGPFVRYVQPALSLCAEKENGAPSQYCHGYVV